MTLGDLIDQARIRLDDVNPEYLNSDEDLIRFANNGVNEICRRALLIKDSSSLDLAYLSLQSDVNLYDIDPRILFIERAGFSSHRLKRISMETLDTIINWEDNYGKPRYFCTDFENGKVLIYPSPTSFEEGAPVRLTVYRMPLEDMVSTADSPEIPAEYHHGVLYWMCYEAFRRQDLDLEAVQKAASELEAFEKLFGPPKDASIFGVTKRRFPSDMGSSLVTSAEGQSKGGRVAPTNA